MALWLLSASPVFQKKKENNNKKQLPKDSLHLFLIFLPFASLVVVKTTLFFPLSQAWAVSFHRTFPSKRLLAFTQASIHLWKALLRTALSKTLQKQGSFQAFHILTAQAKTRKVQKNMELDDF